MLFRTNSDPIIVSHRLYWTLFGYISMERNFSVPKFPTKSWRSSLTATSQDKAVQRAVHSSLYRISERLSCTTAFRSTVSRIPSCVPNVQSRSHRMASRWKSRPTVFSSVFSVRFLYLPHQSPTKLEWILSPRLRYTCNRLVNCFRRITKERPTNRSHNQKYRIYSANPWTMTPKSHSKTT